MSLQLSDIRGRVRNYIDEPSAGYWSDSELNSYISTRQLDLWRRIYRLKSDYWMVAGGFTLNTVKGQSLYRAADGIPATFFRVLSIRTTTSGYTDIVWIYADPNAPDFIDGLRADQPVTNPDAFMYAVQGNGTILISPIPQQVLAAQVDYIQLPSAVSADTDTFLIPDPFLDFVGYAAAADALLKGPVGASDVWQQKAEAAWNDIQMALDMERSDQNPELARSFGQLTDFTEW